MRVVVVGGGFGGLASAARLAKLGHEVTLLERLPDLGGALVPVTAGGHTWDAVTSTLLPAVVRDLFRKSGRPVEQELTLAAITPASRDRFVHVSITPGRRDRQRRAVKSLGDPRQFVAVLALPPDVRLNPCRVVRPDRRGARRKPTHRVRSR